MQRSNTIKNLSHHYQFIDTTFRPPIHSLYTRRITWAKKLNPKRKPKIRWVKEIKPRAAKEIGMYEVDAQETSRFYMPWYPKTRLTISANGKYCVIVDDVPGFKQIQSITASTRGLGKATFHALATTQNYDFKDGNVGVDLNNRVTCVDGDQSYATLVKPKYAITITSRNLDELPHASEGAYNFLFSCIHERTSNIYLSSADLRLRHDPAIRREINEEILTVLVSPAKVQQQLSASYTDDVEFANACATLKNNQALATRAAALKNVSFLRYLNSEAAFSHLANIIDNIKTFHSISKQTLFNDKESDEIAAEIYRAFAELRETVANSPAELSPQEKLFVAVNTGKVAEAKKLLQRSDVNVNEVFADGATLLFLATRFNDKEMVTVLFDHDANPEISMKDGCTALLIAVYYGYASLVELLLDANENNISHYSFRNQTLLHYGIDSESSTIVKSLLDADVNSKTPNHEQHTPLVRVLKNFKNDFELADCILETGADINQIMSSGVTRKLGGRTALNYFAGQGKTDIVEYLLEHGADPSIRAQDGMAPLHTAVIQNHLEVVKLLVVAGANIDQINHQGKTPLQLALQKGLIDIALYLIENKANLNIADCMGETALDFARKLRDQRPFQALLKNNAYRLPYNLETQIEELHAAVIDNDLAKIKNLLLLEGMNIDCPHNKTTPLLLAIHKEWLELSCFLIGQGADINWPNAEGITPLYLAILHNLNSLACELLARGANPHYPTINDVTPLYLAAQQNNKEMVKILINQTSVNTEETTTSGWTALNIACKGGFDDIVELLLKRGANPNHKDNKGWFPLAIASFYGHSEVLKILLANDADRELTFDNKTAEMIAQEKHPEMIELFKVIHETASDTHGSDLTMSNSQSDLNSVSEEESPRYVKDENEGHYKTQITLFTSANASSSRNQMENVSSPTEGRCPVSKEGEILILEENLPHPGVT